MVAVFINLIVFGSLTAIVLFFAYRGHRERMEMLRMGITDFVKVPSKTGGLPLLFGLMFIAVGLAFFAAAFIDYFDSDVFTIGLFGLFIGISLLVYWKATAGDREQKCQWYERSQRMKNEEPHQAVV